MLKYLLPALLLLPVAAQAQTYPDVRPDVRVATHDLDLRSAKGVKILDRRLSYAITTMCGDDTTVDFSQRRAIRRCHANKRAEVAQQRDAVIAAATRGTSVAAAR
ncbi:UrcA family protein [Sphingomonas immobilis]|uniref:UrcA family protein n=1 Tax=Sphingomonas immobilis TaxID=3063997 RepID=A0ABT8ZUR7_9SPHN|nr:UrcA family protein [Sphingomonas sp. CA1-15]MDO7841321.1 UrcA family protein [Sphingomonas sp. CA1-15]